MEKVIDGLTGLKTAPLENLLFLRVPRTRDRIVRSSTESIHSLTDDLRAQSHRFRKRFLTTASAKRKWQDATNQSRADSHSLHEAEILVVALLHEDELTSFMGLHVLGKGFKLAVDLQPRRCWCWILARTRGLRLQHWDDPIELSQKGLMLADDRHRRG